MIILFLLFLIQFSLSIALLAITKDTQTTLAKDGWDNASNSTKLDFMKLADCCGYNEWNIHEDLGCVSSVVLNS